MKTQTEFKRVLGPFSATCIVIGAIVGIGIFFTPKDVALITGSRPLALWTWAIGGAIAMLGALTFAELSGMYLRTGAQYEILRDAFHPSIGFLYVFCNATAIQAGAIAIIAYYSAVNFGVMIQGSEMGPGFNFAGAYLMIIGLAVTNFLGVKWGSAIQNITVITKLATLLLIAMLAFWSTPEEVAPVAAADTTEGASVITLILAGLVPVLFSFGGWQHALWIGGEVRDAKSNLPKAIMIGVAIVTAVYLLANWAYFNLLGFQGVIESKAVAAESVSRIWPGFGQRFIGGAIAFSGFGVLNAQLLCGPRLLCGMARDGKFFSPFATLNSNFNTPVAAIILLAGIGIALLKFAGTDGVDSILNGVVLIDSSFFILTGLALIILRIHANRIPENSNGNDNESRSFRTPWFPIIPALFVVGEVLIVVGAFLVEKHRSSALIAVGWMTAAAIMYFVFFRNKPERPE